MHPLFGPIPEVATAKAGATTTGRSVGATPTAKHGFGHVLAALEGAARSTEDGDAQGSEATHLPAQGRLPYVRRSATASGPHVEPHDGTEPTPRSEVEGAVLAAGALAPHAAIPEATGRSAGTGVASQERPHTRVPAGVPFAYAGAARTPGDSKASDPLPTGAGAKVARETMSIRESGSAAHPDPLPGDQPNATPAVPARRVESRTTNLSDAAATHVADVRVEGSIPEHRDPETVARPPARAAKADSRVSHARPAAAGPVHREPETVDALPAPLREADSRASNAPPAVAVGLSEVHELSGARGAVAPPVPASGVKGERGVSFPPLPPTLVPGHREPEIVGAPPARGREADTHASNAPPAVAEQRSDAHELSGASEPVTSPGLVAAPKADRGVASPIHALALTLDEPPEGTAQDRPVAATPTDAVRAAEAVRRGTTFEAPKEIGRIEHRAPIGSSLHPGAPAPQAATPAIAEPPGEASPAPQLPAVARVIVEHASLAAPVFRIRLEQEGLGRIDIELRRGPGGVRVELSSDAGETRRILSDAAPALAIEIRSAGVALEGVHVGGGGGAFSAGTPAGQEREGSGLPRQAPRDADFRSPQTPAVPIVASPRPGSRGLDLLA